MLDLIPLETSGVRGATRVWLILGTTALTAAWLSIWVALLTTACGVSVLLPGPVQAALVLGGAALTRRLLTSRLGDRLIRVLFTAAAFLVAGSVVWLRFYRAMPSFDPSGLVHAVTTQSSGPVLTLVVIVVVLWGVGGRIGASPLDDFAVFRFFALGLAGLFGGLVLAVPTASRTVPVSLLTGATVLFFGVAFLLLPAAQLATVRARGRTRGTRLPPFDRRWLGTAGAAALGILALAAVLSLTASGTLLTLAADLLARLPDLLVTILFPLIFILGYLAQFLIDAIHALLGPPHTTPLPASRPAKPPRLPPQHLVHTSPVAGAILGGVVLVAAAVLAVVLLSRAIGRLGGLRQETAFEEERESIWSWEVAAAGWQHALNRLRDRLRRAPHLGQKPDVGPPRSVREAYRRLLRRGAGLGHPRTVAETPQEYLGRLHALPIPDERDATLLTAVYMRVRYGDEGEGPEQVEQAARAWEQLDQALRQQQIVHGDRPGGGPAGHYEPPGGRR